MGAGVGSVCVCVFFNQLQNYTSICCNLPSARWQRDLAFHGHQRKKHWMLNSKSTAGKHHQLDLQPGSAFICTIDPHATRISTLLFSLSAPNPPSSLTPSKSQSSLRQPRTTVCLIKNVDENSSSEFPHNTNACDEEFVAAIAAFFKVKKHLNVVQNKWINQHYSVIHGT